MSFSLLAVWLDNARILSRSASMQRRHRPHAITRAKFRRQFLEQLEDRRLLTSSPIPFTGATYSQNFDDLLSPVPTDNTATVSQSVLPVGWGFVEAGTNANTNLRVHSGATTTGDTHLFGATGSNERALGSFASGSLTSQFGARFVNNTGTTLTEFTLSYIGEQWKDGRSTQAVLNSLSFSYSINPTSLTVGTYNDVPLLNFAAPIGGANPQTGSDVALNGNLAANQVSVSSTVASIAWDPGAELWIRWTDINETGNDDALAIDNLQFSASAGLADTDPPVIATLTPADDATGVMPTANLVVQFNEPVAKGIGNIEIRKASDNTLFESIPITASNVAVSGASVTINPAGVLDLNTEYYVTIPSGGFVDLADTSNPFAGITSPATWSFTTVVTLDVTPPSVVSLSPIDDASNVAVNSNLVITFNENVAKGSGSILIRLFSDESIVQTIAISSSAVTVAGAVVTIDPPANLENSTDYYIEVPAGAFQDLAGNNFVGITGDSSWNIATVANLPPVINVNRAITMNPGQTIVISANVLQVVDPENAAITFTVNSVSPIGNLQNVNTVLNVNDTFTQINVSADGGGGTIRFVSTGTSPASTTIGLTATDAAGVSTPLTLTINIASPTEPISYTGGEYTQDFDGLLPTGPFPSNNTTIPASMVLPIGWTVVESGTNANSSIRVDNGAATTGDAYLLGATNDNERALGSQASGSNAPRYGAAIKNDTGSTLSEFTLSYFGERWRNINNANGDRLDFSYMIDASGLGDAGFVDIDSLDFTVGNPGASAPIDGNDPANRTLIMETVTDLSWAPGSVLWIRWSDSDTGGTDSSLAIDNIVFSAAGSTLANPTLTVTAPDAVYTANAYTGASVSITGANVPIPTATFTYYVGIGISGDNLGSTPPTNVGTYTVVASTTANAGNNAATSAHVSFSITQAPATVTADAQSKTYGDSDPALTFVAIGLVGSDTVSGSLTRVTGENVGNYAIQQGSITAGSNYDLTFVGENLQISPRDLIVTADALTKTVGQDDPALTFTTSTLVNGDTVATALTGSLTRAAGETVGIYAINQGTLAAVHGNYTINFLGADFTIDAAAVAPTLSSVVVNGADLGPGGFTSSIQRSMVTSLVVTFSAPVVLSPGAFTITNIGLFAASNINLNQSQLIVTPNATNDVYTIRFGAGTSVNSRLGSLALGNSLADGNYRLTIDPTKVSNPGGNLTGNNLFGAAAADNFFRMYGDANGDGAVNALDRSALMAALAGAVNSAFDFDGNGSTTSGVDTSNYFTNNGKRRRLF